jgi:hypothetical protein
VRARGILRCSSRRLADRRPCRVAETGGDPFWPGAHVLAGVPSRSSGSRGTAKSAREVDSDRAFWTYGAHAEGLGDLRAARPGGAPRLCREPTTTSVGSDRGPRSHHEGRRPGPDIPRAVRQRRPTPRRAPPQGATADREPLPLDEQASPLDRPDDVRSPPRVRRARRPPCGRGGTAGCRPGGPTDRAPFQSTSARDRGSSRGLPGFAAVRARLAGGPELAAVALDDG